MSMSGRSLASSSSSSSSMSWVLRLMQEQRSREAKKAEATLVPTQLATRSSFPQDMKLQLFSIGIGIGMGNFWRRLKSEGREIEGNERFWKTGWLERTMVEIVP